METTISKALMNRLVDAVTTEWGIDKIQDDWIMDNVENRFEGRYPEEPRSTSMEQFMDCIDKAGVKWTKKSNGFYEVTMDNLRIDVSKSNGWTAKRGNLNGVDFRINNHYISSEWQWTSAENLVAFFIETDKAITQWKEKEWPQVIFQAQKKAKMKSINENTIETMLQLKLKGTGIQYALEKQKTRVKALFNIGNNTQVEMFVTHKKFPEQITSVVNTLTAIKQMVDDTGITINMKRLSSGVNWKEV